MVPRQPEERLGAYRTDTDVRQCLSTDVPESYLLCGEEIMGEGSAIDQEAVNTLLDSLGGDEEFLAELMQDYFDDAPDQLAAMESALAAGDAEGLRRAAHSLKSNSTTFGAMTLAGRCKELEDLAKSGNLDGAGARIAEIVTKYERARLALEALQKGK
jgi:HPt (histidine-containing phosphotransfer) domain-containing protein